MFAIQDGMSAEIMALAQGHNETAELLAKLKPVSYYTTRLSYFDNSFFKTTVTKIA